MSNDDLEKTLRDLQRLGTKIADEPGRETWQFEHGGLPYRLHFYRFGSGRAVREYRGLTALQRASVPAPRAIALLTGYRLGTVRGDAVVIAGNLGLIPLDEWLSQLRFDPRKIGMQISSLVRRLGQAKLGHDALDLRAFAVDRSGDLQIVDGEHVTRKGLRLEQIFRLHHAARPFASNADIVRAWRAFGFGAQMPRDNRYSRLRWKEQLRESTRGESEYFGALSVDGWRGRFTKRFTQRYRWAPATQIAFTHHSWQTAWPALLTAIENDQLDILKRGDNGDVLRGEIIIDGQPLSIVVKRPRRKSVRQAIGDAFRPSRARRTWARTWKVFFRSIPCEAPLLVMERRVLGYVTDAVLVFGTIDGPTLAAIDLDSMNAAGRARLFHRAGRTLRQIEQLGFTHMDAKSTNWIISDPLSGEPLPLLVDLDGVRHYRWTGAGIERLLRAMKQHPQYTPADSLALCQGYAPRADLIVEETVVEETGVEETGVDEAGVEKTVVEDAGE